MGTSLSSLPITYVDERKREKERENYVKHTFLEAWKWVRNGFQLNSWGILRAYKINYENPKLAKIWSWIRTKKYFSELFHSKDHCIIILFLFHSIIPKSDYWKHQNILPAIKVMHTWIPELCGPPKINWTSCSLSWTASSVSAFRRRTFWPSSSACASTSWSSSSWPSPCSSCSRSRSASASSIRTSLDPPDRPWRRPVSRPCRASSSCEPSQCRPGRQALLAGPCVGQCPWHRVQCLRRAYVCGIPCERLGPATKKKKVFFKWA